MGFTINEKITTELHYKDVANITTSFYAYIESYGDNMNEDHKREMNHLADRLMRELYNHPDNDIPNGDN